MVVGSSLSLGARGARRLAVRRIGTCRLMAPKVLGSRLRLRGVWAEQELDVGCAKTFPQELSRGRRSMRSCLEETWELQLHVSFFEAARADDATLTVGRVIGLLLIARSPSFRFRIAGYIWWVE